MAGVYVTLVAGLFLIAAISNGTGNPLTLLGSVLFLSPVWLLALVGLLALHSRLDRRAAGRLPPGPGQGAHGAPGQGHAGTRDDPALPDDHAGPPSAELRAQEPGRDPAGPFGSKCPDAARPRAGTGPGLSGPHRRYTLKRNSTIWPYNVRRSAPRSTNARA
jgi:hypothetical protein